MKITRIIFTFVSLFLNEITIDHILYCQGFRIIIEVLIVKVLYQGMY